MNISKQTLNFNDIEENLDAIKKKLYLESPDLWIDFCDKVDEKILDEMVLFYASKYNYSNVIKFAMIIILQILINHQKIELILLLKSI